MDAQTGAVEGMSPNYRVGNAPALDVVERELAAARVLGIAHGGPLTMADLSGVARKLDEAARAAGVDRAGPIFTMLRSNPYEVAPGRRSYFTCVPVRGAVAAPEGTSLGRLVGGLCVIATTTGGLSALEGTFGFLFGRLLPTRGHELARPDDPEIRLLYLTPPHEVRRPSELAIQVAVPLSTSMRTDTLRNQR